MPESPAFEPRAGLFYVYLLLKNRPKNRYASTITPGSQISNTYFSAQISHAARLRLER